MEIKEDVLFEMIAEIGSRPAEEGGLLIGPVGQETVTLFVYDNEGGRSGVTYTPSPAVNEVLPLLAEEGLDLKGFVHSHPGLETPSDGDLRYVAAILEANPQMERVYLPIMPWVPIPRHEDFDPLRKVKWWIVSRSMDAPWQMTPDVID